MKDVEIDEKDLRPRSPPMGEKKYPQTATRAGKY
jgi:hypothetical protein